MRMPVNVNGKKVILFTDGTILNEVYDPGSDFCGEITRQGIGYSWKVEIPYLPVFEVRLALGRGYPGTFGPVQGDSSDWIVTVPTVRTEQAWIEA